MRPSTNALHEDAVVVDAHNDLLMTVAAREPEEWGRFFENQWLPQLCAGGVDVQILPVFIDTSFQPELALRQTMRMVAAARAIAAHCSSRVVLCTTRAEINDALRAGKIALLLALEGCPAIGPDLSLFSTLHALGVRVAALTHYGRNALADGSGEDAAGSRLTRAGIAAVRELERLGIALDVSHLGAAGVEHVLELSTRPVVATHSSARVLCDHHRNLTDSQIRGIAESGGIVCVNFFPGFIDESEPTLDRLIDHIAHICEIAGPRHVGLGPDFVHEVFSELTPPWCDHLVVEGLDPFAFLPGLEGPRGLPSVTEALVRRGFAEDTIRGVLGGNMLRFLAETLE